MAELAYALVLGTSPARVRGSNPLEGTKKNRDENTVFYLCLNAGFEPKKGSGKRIFPVAELFKPRGLKERV